MSNPLATYSFLPWLRQGIANNITQADGAVVPLRASIPIRITLAGTRPDGEPIPAADLDVPAREIHLYGPGDITGIDSRAIIKTEPRNWITNFEPNYLPYIDFYEEDFPWRYTPAAPNGDRLRPWLTLVVLKEEEFEDGSNMKKSPLPWFRLRDGSNTADIFPNPAELWAWAHVHVNEDLSNDAPAGSAPESAEITQRISDIIRNNPDLAYSRIISPRKLEANMGYHAFLIPTFESGRLAGLGRDISADLVATAGAWDDPSHTEFPYYHRWYFRTGTVGDFEYLVNLLEPKPADKSVGVRDMDVLHPGSNLPAINNPALNGILRLGGALRVPLDTLSSEDRQEVRNYERWNADPYPHPFTEAMAARINLADDYVNSDKPVGEINRDAGIVTAHDETDPDPVITSPMYGRWHALQQRLLKDRVGNDLPYNSNWVHELNLDPRFRVAAGLGTGVVQKNQEEYMQAAWEQVGKIVEANHKIRLAQMAKEVSSGLYANNLLPQLFEKAFVFTAPVHRRVVDRGSTVQAQVARSVVPPALTSGVFRRIARPRGALMKRFQWNESVDPSNLLQRINDGLVTVAPPKQDPSGVVRLEDAIRDAENEYKGLIEFLGRYGFPGRQKPDSVNGYPLIGNFRITAPPVRRDLKPQPDEGFKPETGKNDSIEGGRFKEALKDTLGMLGVNFPEAPKAGLDLKGLTDIIVQGINPAVTIPKRTFNLVKLPGRISANMRETFAPVMVYPEIDIPMYKPLADISSELFLPNLNKIGQNSITLLENNQRFIEAYMVGINHEMSRELLWREYPTDQRGTYFRQFWDVNSFLPSGPATDDLKEQLRDIPPIHKWSKVNAGRTVPSDPDSVRRNELGSHNQRAQDGKTQLVLVIRGELLKKYPTAVVYAQKAAWGNNSDGEADVNAERILMPFTGDEAGNLLKTPLFEAKIDPDIYFFGFDLDDEEARGTQSPTSTGDDPGWFFVLRERPGEPRFGLDIGEAGRIINWNNLSWEDVGTREGECIALPETVADTISFQEYDSLIDQENEPVADDVQANWSSTTHSAELAYILYQVPVMVAIHATRMLPD